MPMRRESYPAPREFRSVEQFVSSVLVSRSPLRFPNSARRKIVVASPVSAQLASGYETDAFGDGLDAETRTGQEFSRQHDTYAAHIVGDADLDGNSRPRDQGRRRRSRLACGQKMMTASRHSEQSFRASPLFKKNVDQSQLGSTSMSRCTIADQLARDYFLAFASPALCI
jgi:hypothetical protein